MKKTRQWIVFLWIRSIAFVLILVNWKKNIIRVNWNYTQQQGDFKQFYIKLCRHTAFSLLDFLFNYSNVQYSSRALEIIPKLSKGGILVTAHLGNWEILGKSLAKAGVPILAAYKPLHSKLLDRLLKHLRNKPIEYVFPLDGSIESLRKLYASKHLVTILVDQEERNPIKAHSSLFLSRVVHSSRIPNSISKNRPVYYASAIYQDQFTLLIDIQKMDTFDYDLYHTFLEKDIHQHIDQWIGWTHRRFLKTAPGLYSRIP